VKRLLSAQQARTLLNTVQPRDVAAEPPPAASCLIHELAPIDKKIKSAIPELTDLTTTPPRCRCDHHLALRVCCGRRA
jgi:hypothetical protein